MEKGQPLPKGAGTTDTHIQMNKNKIKLRYRPIRLTKINSKINHISKCEIKITTTTQLFKDNSGENPGGLGLGDDFLNTTPNDGS